MARLIGAMAVLSKPYSGAVLLEAIDRVMRAPQLPLQSLKPEARSHGDNAARSASGTAARDSAPAWALGC